MTDWNVAGSTAESQRPPLGPTAAMPTPAPAAGGVIQYGPPPSYDKQGRLRAPDEAGYYDLASYSAPGPGSAYPGSASYNSAAGPLGLPPAVAAPATSPPGWDDREPTVESQGRGRQGRGGQERRGQERRGQEHRARGRRPGASTVVGLLALVTAVLAAASPMLTFWIGRYGSGDPGDLPGHFHVNGYGHTFYGTALDASSPAGAHDTDYGVPLLAAAVVLALAAVALITRLRRDVAGLLLAIVGGALSAGVAVEGLMDRGARFSLDDAHDHWSVGAGWWLMAAAGIGGAVVAVAAAVLIARLIRSPAAALPVAQESWGSGQADLVGAPVPASHRHGGV